MGTSSNKSVLPKGFAASHSSNSEVERMIGRRVENMTVMITLSFIAAWLATLTGTTIGYVYYPWAYPMPTAIFAFGGLTVFEAIGYLFCVKVSEEGSKKKSNKTLAIVLIPICILTILLAMFPIGLYF